MKIILKIIFVLAVLGTSVGLTARALAAEDFDSYSLGALSGQGSWTTITGQSLGVVNAYAHSASNSVTATTSAAATGKLAVATTTFARYSVRILRHGDVVVNDHFFSLTKSNGAYGVRVGINNGEDAIFYANGTSTNMGSISADTWHFLTLSINTLTGIASSTLDGGTEYHAGIGTGFDYVNGVYFNDPGGDANKVFWDDLDSSFSNFDSFCSSYHTETSCNAISSCTWWFSDYLFSITGDPALSSACISSSTAPADYSQPNTPYPTQAACEAAGNTWIPDSGCYASSSEPIIDVNAFYQLTDLFHNPSGFVQNIFNAFDLRKKAPFSWVVQTYQVINEELTDREAHRNSSSTLGAFSPFQLYLPGFNTTTTITFISFAWITDNFATQFALLRQILGFCLWWAFIFYLIKRVSSFFAPLFKDQQ